jgi:hypothetical protein
MNEVRRGTSKERIDDIPRGESGAALNVARWASSARSAGHVAALLCNGRFCALTLRSPRPAPAMPASAAPSRRSADRRKTAVRVLVASSGRARRPPDTAAALPRVAATAHALGRPPAAVPVRARPGPNHLDRKEPIPSYPLVLSPFELLTLGSALPRPPPRWHPRESWSSPLLPVLRTLRQWPDRCVCDLRSL